MEVGKAATKAVRPASTRKPSVAAGGFFTPIGRSNFTAMECRASWDNSFFELICSGDWQYGSSKADHLPQPDVNQASWLSSHLPFDGNRYLLTIKQLLAAGRQ